MARPNVPTIPDDKVRYFREELLRELAHMFKWDGLPDTVPIDYLERNLVRHGHVMYYEDENIGQDVLRAEPWGFNRHEQPTQARSFYFTEGVDTELPQHPHISRKVKRLSDSKNAVEQFDITEDCVLIQNMHYGQNAWEIVEHFAKRLAMVQQGIDTQLMWSNVPYVFQTASEDTRLSIEKMFDDIFSGKPFVIADKDMFKDNTERTGVPSGIDFIAKDLYDVKNEIKMDFRQTVGFDTAGVEKAERVNTLEIKSNDQHTATVLDVMLRQREIAVESINAFFGTDITVSLTGQDEIDEQEELFEGEGEEFGTSDSGAGAAPGED